ncbi:unnamed protein product [Cuscuta epithymum]|uniref:Ubiquitin-like protease family profile domain-containing protein n=1 Tax=Cuscuta epithymum TaxID=186058 RepID=A0AAV0CDC1_9ASTE|nr:unnamed protein product [Cuscuta epithymum]
MKVKNPTVPLLKPVDRPLLVQLSQIQPVTEDKDFCHDLQPQAIDEPSTTTAEIDKIHVPLISAHVDSELFPPMKLTIKNSLRSFQTQMRQCLYDYPELLDEFRRSIFGRYLDIDFIPVPALVWPLLVRLSKMERSSDIWFVLKGVPIRYSIVEFALITGLNCSFLDKDRYEKDYDEHERANFIHCNWPAALRGGRENKVSYKTILHRFKQLCKNLKDNNQGKREEAHREVIRVAILMFIVMVLLGPARRNASVPDWILGKVACSCSLEVFPWGTWAFLESLNSLNKNLQKKLDEIICKKKSRTLCYTGFLLPISILLFECVPDFAKTFAFKDQQSVQASPRICLWKLKRRKKIDHKDVDEALQSVKSVQSILAPDSREAEADWVLSLKPLHEDHLDSELNAYVRHLEKKLVLIPVCSTRSKSRKQEVEFKETPPPKKARVDYPHMGNEVIHELRDYPPTPNNWKGQVDSTAVAKLMEQLVCFENKFDDFRENVLNRLVSIEGHVVLLKRRVSEYDAEKEIHGCTAPDESQKGCVQDLLSMVGFVRPSSQMSDQNKNTNKQVQPSSHTESSQMDCEDVVVITQETGRGQRIKRPSYKQGYRSTMYCQKPKSSAPSNDTLEAFRVFIHKAIEEKREVQCNLYKTSESEGKARRWWTELLTPGGWLGDLHMDEYMFVLRRRVHEEKISHVVVLTEFFSGMCERNARDPIFPEVRERMKEIVDGTYGAPYIKPWKNISFVYFPHNIGRSHWVAIRADFEKGKLTVFDSLRTFMDILALETELIHLRKMFPILAHHCGLGPHTAHRKPLWDVVRPNAPQQITNDCGVFALKFIELNMQRRPFDDLQNNNSKQISLLRLRMAYDICLEYQLSLQV